MSKFAFRLPHLRITEHVSIQDKINFTRHLAIIIKAGLPVFEGLKIVRKQTASRTMMRVIDQLIVDVNNGQFMASSLERYRHLFGDFFISIIRVGETSGTLAANLLYLSDELKKAKALRGRVRTAMIYPVILLLATISISAFLTFFIFPKIIPVFESLDVELPVTTKTLIAVLGFLRAYGWAVALGVIAWIVLFRFILKIEMVRYLYHSLLIRIPVVSTLVISVNIANFTRILALLLKSGTKIVEAMIIVSNTVENVAYRKALQRAADEVSRGEPFSKLLIKEKRMFPTILAAMIEVGENTGNLEENLSYLADYYTEEVELSIRNLTALMEPLIILVMGLVVAFVALSIITPIYSVSQGLQK